MNVYCILFPFLYSFSLFSYVNVFMYVIVTVLIINIYLLIILCVGGGYYLEREKK